MPFLPVLPHADFAIVMGSVRRSDTVIVGVGRILATSIVIELVATVPRLNLMIFKRLVSPSLDGRGSGSEECSKEYHLFLSMYN